MTQASPSPADTSQIIRHRLTFNNSSSKSASSLIYNKILANIHFKPIHTKSRSSSHEKLLSVISTGIAQNTHCHVILSGPRKAGKIRMLRHILDRIMSVRKMAMRDNVNMMANAQQQHGMMASSDSVSNQKKVRVMYMDCLETQKQFVNILKGGFMSWIFQEKMLRGDIQEEDGESDNSDAADGLLDHNLDNAYDIISEEQLGEIEALIVTLSTQYNIYPIIVFKHFDRVCKLANKAIYHLLDTSHTTKVGMGIIGVSQSINLHTILDKGTGSTGKLGGIIGSYTRIKSRLYNGKFVLVKTFRNEDEIIEAIADLLDVSQYDTLNEDLVKVYSSALAASLSEPNIFTPLLLYPDCSALVHVCRRVVERIRARDTLQITLVDWSVAIDEWLKCEDRLLHLESFNNLELCIMLAARDIEEQILTPSQENNRQDQKLELKKDWFSFTDVYTRFMERIGKTSNLDIKSTYASKDHMIPDITTDRAACQVAYKSLFDKGFLKRFDKRTVLEDSKARFHQLHPEEIRAHITKHADSYHTSLVQWAEEHI